MMTWEYLISLEHLKIAGIAIGIFLLFLLFRKIFTKYIFQLLVKLGKKAKTNIIPSVLAAFERPVQWLFVIIGLYAAVKYYPHFNQIDMPIWKFSRVFIIFLITWGLLNLSSSSSQLFKLINDKTNIKIDDILIPFLSRSLQVVIIAISISVILQELNYQIGGFLTGLGLGGLAFSLAAQDAIANLFGGIVIITEKPFTIGDWITTPSVDGTVEDISFRSTKIRTFSDALVTVPNATLSNEPITNWSKMGKRQITFNIPITYDASTNAVERVVKRIEDTLTNNPAIHQETIYVKVNQLTSMGMELMLNFFTKTTDYDPYIKTREEINLTILRILDEEGVEIAPSLKKMLRAEDTEA
ncbi:MAG TPA: mechanosensitive ion channel family protein [Pseudogracilibacillus sp.]|nr:mechanosensitive ion channel family protein [Pseudogracilibacillus sp.]